MTEPQEKQGEAEGGALLPLSDLEGKICLEFCNFSRGFLNFYATSTGLRKFQNKLSFFKFFAKCLKFWN